MIFFDKSIQKKFILEDIEIFGSTITIVLLMTKIYYTSQK